MSYARSADATPVRDFARRPRPAMLWWGLPLVIGLSTNLAPLSLTEVAAVWSAALAWMGVGCVVNAVRCHRLHCFISAPALLGGAAVAALVAAGVWPTSIALNLAIFAAFGLTLLSFVPELVWRRYL